MVIFTNSSQHVYDLSIPIVNDNVSEPIETLYVQLHASSEEFLCVTLQPATTELFILDDDQDFSGKSKTK